MIYDGVFKVSCGTSVTLAEETKAISKEWAAVRQRQQDISQGRAIEDPAPPPAPEPTYTVPLNGRGPKDAPRLFPIPQPQRYTYDKFDYKESYKKKNCTYYWWGGCEKKKERLAGTSI